MNYIVYKTINLINGKIYVGVHRTNPDIFDGYIGCGVTHKDPKNKTKGFPNAVKKYGYHNFKRETLFVYPDTELGMIDAYAKEAEIVNTDFIKSSKTYNLALGGKFTLYNNVKKEISQYTLDGKFIRTWDSITEALNATGIYNISNNLRGRCQYCGNFIWKYYTKDTKDIDPVDSREKTVYLFDLQGNLLKVWKSASIASLEFSNSYSARAAINNSCLNKTHQAFGYYWSYKNKFNYNPPGVAVAKYTDNGVFIESYTSLKNAAEAHGLKSASNIISAISGKQKRCSGFRWRYFYGNTSNIKPLKDNDIV